MCEASWFRNERVHLRLAQIGLTAWGDSFEKVTLNSVTLVNLSSLCHNSDTPSEEGAVKRFGRDRG